MICPGLVRPTCVSVATSCKRLYALLLLYVLTAECLTLAIAYMSHWQAELDKLKHMLPVITTKRYAEY